MYLYYISLAMRHNGGRGAHHLSPAAAPCHSLQASAISARIARRSITIAAWPGSNASGGRNVWPRAWDLGETGLDKSHYQIFGVYGCASAKLASSLLSVPGPCFIARRHSSGTSARTRPAKTRCMSLSLAASHACWRGQSTRFPGSMCRRQTLSGCYDPPANSSHSRAYPQCRMPTYRHIAATRGATPPSLQEPDGAPPRSRPALILNDLHAAASESGPWPDARPKPSPSTRRDRPCS